MIGQLVMESLFTRLGRLPVHVIRYALETQRMFLLRNSYHLFFGITTVGPLSRATYVLHALE